MERAMLSPEEVIELAAFVTRYHEHYLTEAAIAALRTGFGLESARAYAVTADLAIADEERNLEESQIIHDRLFASEYARED